ncbi:Ubiquitin carboxyl-terminal hydrolase 17-like protein D [Holothuria leucospilota]|uniref:Ubiquitin carboxyl-terminal hydrolase 17-like protein D n=1 Tax=Holothuria leucospilota TaxID=206669 RepID=A0A9Q1CSC7_HOLLE|nr:Ubiquitin carboxyl-terminal hydrolase 17-like protein D [Holothuria leucospilota]
MSNDLDHIGQDDADQQSNIEHVPDVVGDNVPYNTNQHENDQRENSPNVRCSRCKTNQSKSFSSIMEELPSCLVLLVNRTRAGGRKSSAKQYSLSALEIAALRVGLSQRRYLNYTYNLTSAVVHTGVDCKCGHYYAYVFHSDGTVFLYDDSTVKRRNAESALKDIERNQCLLFYHLAIGTHDQREDEPVHDVDDIGVQRTTKSQIYGDEWDTQDKDHSTGFGKRVQDNSPQGQLSHGSPDSSFANRDHDDDVPLSEATLSHLASAQLFTKYFEAEIPKYAWFK